MTFFWKVLFQILANIVFAKYLMLQNPKGNRKEGVWKVYDKMKRKSMLSQQKCK